MSLLVVPVRLESAVSRDPVALLQLVPEGREDPVEGMPHYDQRGGVLPPQQGLQGGLSDDGGHHPGLQVGLAEKKQRLSDVSSQFSVVAKLVHSRTAALLPLCMP